MVETIRYVACREEIKVVKKIHCSGCNGTASYQSERWPSMKLCYSCVSRVLTWLAIEGLADGNPFAIELASDVFKLKEWNGVHYYEVWGPSQFIGATNHSYSTYGVNLEKSFD